MFLTYLDIKYQDTLSINSYILLQFEKLKHFADEIDFKLEFDPDVVKETLEKGLKDPEKGGDRWKIRPISINDDPKYTPIYPYDHSKL